MLVERLKNLSIKNFFILGGVFILKPFLIVPTYKGTKSTILACNSCFGKEHHGDTRSNAFRHALWNYLICEQCYKTTGSLGKALAWSKRITDLHEELSPNSKLAKEMDLHNNRIGRDLFAEHHEIQIDHVEELQKMTTNAVKISSSEDIRDAKDKLVYIED